MAVAQGTQYVVVEIQENWYNFHLAPDGKYVTLMGYDKNDQSISPFTGQPYFEIRVLVPVAYEHHRSDYAFNEIIGEAYDDNGKKYLIIHRTPEK